MSQHSFLPASAPHRPGRRAALAAALLLPLAACNSGGSGDGTSSSDVSDSGGAATGAGGLSLVDPWVKTAEHGMTSAFGTLVNATDHDLQLIAASTPASAEVQLHETASDGSGGMSM